MKVQEEFWDVLSVAATVSMLDLQPLVSGSPALTRPRIVVGMSGGVDSSAAAALLVEQGYEVIGVTLWLMKGKGQCCSEGMVDAATVCEQLGIPHHLVDSREAFTQNIVNYLIGGYQEGITPLPCSQCNRTVKFSPMIDYAQRQFGIPLIATGHYARVVRDPQTGRYALWRAVDRNKDQSYFLYDLTQEQLAHVVFPLGAITKPLTRFHAERLGLSTAHKPESQDLCLVEAHGSMNQFLDQHLPPRQGEIVDSQGRVLGHHEGIHHYTVGQRKGLGIAAPHPLYVLRLDPALNRVIVGEREEALCGEATVHRVNWVAIPPPDQPLAAAVQVRYRSEAVPVTVIPLEDHRVRLIFAEPQFAITPGQAAVWYDGDRLLGGGILERQNGR